MNSLFGYQTDASGKTMGLSPLPTTVEEVSPECFSWLHATATDTKAHEWLDAAELPTIAHAAQLADETRPRCTVHDDWALLNLRGVNLSPGAEPEDMVSLRLYLTASVVVSVNKRDLVALSDVADEAEKGRGPTSTGDLVARLALRLADRAEPVVAMLNERIDDLEEAAGNDPNATLRADLADVRRVSITLRRFMFPQRDALSTLEIEEFDWISAVDRARLREATERMTRLCEELDLIRDRAQVVHDMIMDMRAEAMNRQTMLLSVVAAIFLPLGLVTGLLGINVGGIPGAQSGAAFGIVCAGLLGIAGFQLWLFRRMGLLGSRKRQN